MTLFVIINGLDSSSDIRLVKIGDEFKFNTNSTEIERLTQISINPQILKVGQNYWTIKV